MERRSVLLLGLAGAALCAAGPAVAAKPPALWDGLVLTPSKRLDLVYLQPGADFRPYTKVLLDPTQIAFAKNWRRDYNSSTLGLTSRVSESDVQKMVSEGVVAAGDLFAEAWQAGGYPVVTAAGEDVLRITTAIINISVSAPDRPTAGRSKVFADDAGEATLVVEARDSLTGAILGRAVDRRIAGDTTVGWRNVVTNRSDFRRLVKRWADASVRGLAVLKELSPISGNGASS